MDYRFLGRTGLRVSPLCLGTMNFGPHTDEATSHQLMDSALESGVNFFDTANVYGGTETEQIIGRWFAQGGGRREKTVLATKVYGGGDQWPNTSKLSALHIRQACDDSLRRLQTDHIDLYQMHHVDRDTPWDEIWQAMDLLVAAGQGALRRQLELRRLARRAGQRGRQAAGLAGPGVGAEPLQPQRPHGRARGAAGVSGVRGRRHPVEPARRRPARRGAAQGHRGPSRRRARPDPGGATTATSSRRGSRCAPSSARILPTWRWRGCSTSRPSPPRSSDPAPPSSSPGRYHALEITLEPDTLDALDKIFPGPGGAAPEAYAW